MAKAKTYNLSIRLIKKDITNDDEILNISDAIERLKLDKKQNLDGELFVRKSATRPPKWLGFVQPAVSSTLTGIFNASAASLLLLKVDGRRFAITFGQAWHWINDSAIERRFGLITALNSIGDNEIRVVDAQQIDTLSISRRTASSRSSDINVFGLDVQRDLMRAVTGKPKSSDVGTGIVGADALRLTCKLTIDQLAEKCAQLLKISMDKSYKDTYPWVDNIAYIKDKAEIAELDGVLLARINAQNIESMYLASPRIPDLLHDDGYRYDFDDDDDDPRPDVSIDEWLDGTSDELPIDLDYLKSTRIEIFAGGSDSAIDAPSVYQFLIFEVMHNNKLCCLANGDWFEVDKNHVKAIDKSIASVKKSAIKFVDYAVKEDEGAYNGRLSKAINSACLDKQNVIYGGGRSRIEICDVLTKKPELVHVKKSCASSLLSHLFNQGVVSGQLILEPDFRKLCRNKAPSGYKTLFDDANFDARKTEIVYGIITKNADKVPASLPFFSKQTLLNSISTLTKYGYSVSVAGIDDRT